MIVILAIFFGFYSSANPEMAGDVLSKFDVSPDVSKLISGGIWTTLVLLAGSFAVMVLAEVGNLFK